MRYKNNSYFLPLYFHFSLEIPYLKILISLFSLLQLMPTVNVDLLRHLMGALYSISKHSSVNHMTAYNLSVYMAPSILSLHSLCSMGLGNDISKKVMRPLISLLGV